jgi:hypothetical protein
LVCSFRERWHGASEIYRHYTIPSIETRIQHGAIADVEQDGPAQRPPFFPPKPRNTTPSSESSSTTIGAGFFAPRVLLCVAAAGVGAGAARCERDARGAGAACERAPCERVLLERSVFDNARAASSSSASSSSSSSAIAASSAPKSSVTSAAAPKSPSRASSASSSSSSDGRNSGCALPRVARCVRRGSAEPVREPPRDGGWRVLAGGAARSEPLSEPTSTYGRFFGCGRGLALGAGAGASALTARVWLSSSRSCEYVTFGQYAASESAYA